MGVTPHANAGKNEETKTESAFGGVVTASKPLPYALSLVDIPRPARERTPGDRGSFLYSQNEVVFMVFFRARPRPSPGHRFLLMAVR
jgi:hypothetical protein